MQGQQDFTERVSGQIKRKFSVNERLKYYANRLDRCEKFLKVCTESEVLEAAKDRKFFLDRIFTLIGQLPT